jgi:peptide/nickel transport system substrate-binding protein
LFSSMSYAAWVSQMTVIGLAGWDDKNNLYPMLATEIPSVANGGVSADGLTITWKLKPDLKWSDGQPLTSADVKFTWEADMDPKNAPYTRSGYDQVASIDTPDATTAVIHFSKLYPDWQVMFTSGPNNQGQLLPEHILKGQTGLEKNAEIHQPTVASGPWVITEWVAGDHMTFKPNPNYYAGKPKLDQINIKFVPDPETQLAALKTGDVQVGLDFAESDIPTLTALEPAIHMRVDSGPEFEHMLFNLGITNSTVKDASGKVVGNSDQPGPCALTDVNVRKAIILGIDRETMVQTLLEGKTTVPASLWPNSYWTNTSLTPYPYDPEQAKTLLDTAGYKPGADGIRVGKCGGKDVKLSFTFETTTKQLRKDIGAAVQDMLSKIGVEMKPTYTPAGTFFGTYDAGANMATGKYDLVLYTTGFYPAPYTDGFLCSSVTSKDNKGGDNNYHICDAKLDELFAKANASADPAVRKPIFDEIQKYQYDNALFVPMYVRANVNAYLDSVVIPPTSVISGILYNTANWDLK